MSGFYLMHRGWMSNPVFRTDSERVAWVWLIERAAFKDTHHRIGAKLVPIKRGQFAATVREIAEAWGWSKSKVDRFLKVMREANMIRSETGTGAERTKMVITICNYERYQDPRDSGGTETGTGAGQARDSGGTVKKEGKEGKEYPPHSPPEGGAEDHDFHRWYAEYPKHCDMGPAERAYAAAREIADADELLAAAKAFAALCRARDTSPEFIAKPHVWLQKKRWLDDEIRRPPPVREGTENKKWRTRLQAYAERGFWIGMFGPKPGEPGCLAPDDLVAEIVKAAA